MSCSPESYTAVSTESDCAAHSTRSPLATASTFAVPYSTAAA